MLHPKPRSSRARPMAAPVGAARAPRQVVSEGFAFSAALPSGVSCCFLAADAAALASNSARCLAAFSSRMSSIFFFFFRWMAFGWSPSSSSVDLSQASLASSSSSSPSHLSDGFTGSSFFDVPGSKSSASDKRGRI